MSSSALSVLINPKDPHAVELRQLGDEHGEQGNGVHHKMDPVVFGVEAGENVPEWDESEEEEVTERTSEEEGDMFIYIYTYIYT